MHPNFLTLKSVVKVERADSGVCTTALSCVRGGLLVVKKEEDASIPSGKKSWCSALSMSLKSLGDIAGGDGLCQDARQVQRGGFSVGWSGTWLSCCYGGAQPCTATGNVSSSLGGEKCSFPSTDLQYLVLTRKMNLQRICKSIY